VFPDTLETLDLYDNDLRELPLLPDSLSVVDLSKNLLRRITNVPIKVQNFDCDNNPNLKFTPEQTNVLDALKKQSDRIIALNTDDDFYASSSPDTANRYLNHNRLPDRRNYNHNHNHIQSNSGNHGSIVNHGNNVSHQDVINAANNFFDSRRPAPGHLVNKHINNHVNNMSNMNNMNNVNNVNIVSSLDHSLKPSVSNANHTVSRGFGNFGSLDSFINNFDDSKHAPGTSLTNDMNMNTNMNMNNRNNFNNIASNNLGMGRFNGMTHRHPILQYPQHIQQPQYPPHIAKLLMSDGFVPGKHSDRQIKHTHIYYA
jgi:hypothetical protein